MSQLLVILLFVFSLLVITSDYGLNLDVKIDKTPQQLGVTVVPRTLKIQITDSGAVTNTPYFDKYFDIVKVTGGNSEMLQWSTIRQENDQFEINQPISADLPIEFQIRKCNTALRAKNPSANAQPCVDSASMVDRMMIDVTVGPVEEQVLESQVLGKNVNPNFVKMSVERLELRYSLIERLAQTFGNRLVLVQSAVSASLGSETEKISPLDDLSFESGRAELTVTKSSSRNILSSADPDLLFVQKLDLDPVGKLDLGSKFKIITVGTPLINSISMVMGIYYFLWIILGSNLMMDYSDHCVLMNHIDRFEDAKDRRPNFWLSFICCCGSARSSLVEQKRLLDEKSDVVVLTNQIRRLKENQRMLIKALVEPEQQHLYIDNNESPEIEQIEMVSMKVETWMNIRNKTNEHLLLEKYFKALKQEQIRSKLNFQSRLWRWGDNQAQNGLLQNLNLDDSMIDHLDLKFELDKQDQRRPSKKQIGFMLEGQAALKKPPIAAAGLGAAGQAVREKAAFKPVAASQAGAANQRKKSGWGVAKNASPGASRDGPGAGGIRRPANPIQEELGESLFSSGITTKQKQATVAPKLPKQVEVVNDDDENEDPHLFSGFLSPRPEDLIPAKKFNFTNATKINIVQDKKPSIAKAGAKKKESINLPKQMGKNKDQVKGEILDVKNQINKINNVVKALDLKNSGNARLPAQETELSISIQHSNRDENRFRRVRHGEDEPVTPARNARGALARQSVKLGQAAVEISDEDFEFQESVLGNEQEATINN